MLELSPVDALLRALSEPTRRAMVERLARGPATVSELARPFDVSLAAIVQHVQILEEAGVIRSEKTGRVRTCALRPHALDVLEQWIDAHRLLAERRLDRLAALLDAEHPDQSE